MCAVHKTNNENILRFIQLYCPCKAIKSIQSAKSSKVQCISPMNDMGKLRCTVLTVTHFNCTLTLM